MSKKMMKNLPKWCQQKWKKEDHSCCTQSQPKRKEEIMSHHNTLVLWKLMCRASMISINKIQEHQCDSQANTQDFHK
jgi:hypothetical protein